MSRRIGKFYLPQSMLMTMETATVLGILSFIPTRVEHIYHQMEFEYIGFSELFREVSEGEIIPTYNIIVTKEHGEIVHVSPVEITKY